ERGAKCGIAGADDDDVCGLRRHKRSLRRLRYAAMRLGPGSGIVHEFFGLPQLALVEGAAFLGDLEHVPPRCQRMQRDTKLTQDLLSLRENVVEEKHEYMFDNGAGVAQRLAEIHLAAAVRRHVLDQEHAVAGLDMTLDLRVAAKALRLFAHILH